MIVLLITAAKKHKQLAFSYMMIFKLWYPNEI